MKAVIFKIIVYQGLVTYPSCVFEKWVLNQRGINKKWYSHKLKWMQIKQLKGVKPKMKEHKSRHGVNW